LQLDGIDQEVRPVGAGLMLLLVLLDLGQVGLEAGLELTPKPSPLVLPDPLLLLSPLALPSPLVLPDPLVLLGPLDAPSPVVPTRPEAWMVLPDPWVLPDPLVLLSPLDAPSPVVPPSPLISAGTTGPPRPTPW